VRLGLLGGTFDPPHIGHLIAAQDALQVLALERVALVPAASPPHKQDRPVTPVPHRLAMLRLACADDARFALETMELERIGPSYTVDTLRALADRGDQIFLLIGADQYAEFATWRDPDEVRRLATLGVMGRAGELVPSGAGGPDVGYQPVIQVPVTRIDVSSTMIRQAVAAGRSIKYLVPPAVEAYIREHRLYLPAVETAAAGEGTLRDSHSSINDRR
jgi:nicotinate-nucleotide adenylyltransferase